MADARPIHGRSNAIEFVQRATPKKVTHTQDTMTHNVTANMLRI